MDLFISIFKLIIYFDLVSALGSGLTKGVESNVHFELHSVVSVDESTSSTVDNKEENGVSQPTQKKYVKKRNTCTEIRLT